MTLESGTVTILGGGADGTGRRLPSGSFVLHAVADVTGVGGVSLLNDGRIVIIRNGDELYRLAAAAQARLADGVAGQV